MPWASVAAVTFVSGYSSGLFGCRMPKNLECVLLSAGPKLPFSGVADFSSIHPGLFISHVIHKAFIDVNEEGTEAAAATAVMTETGAPREPAPPKVFHADHPFLFLIKHTQSAQVLFIGRVTDPTEK